MSASERSTAATPGRIGVAIPTLNSARTLDWTLLALRRQLGIEVELMVADSGSTDDTLKICERWGVPHVFVPRGNMYRAVNAALRELETPWLTYLNSDDIVYPLSYARLVETGERTEADVVYGDCDYMDDEGRYLYGHKPARRELFSALFRSGIMPFSQPASIFRRDVFAATGGFNETERTVSDYAFFLRAHSAGRRFVGVGGESVAAFRVHDNQLSHVARDGIVEEVGRVLAGAGLRRRAFDRLAVWRWRAANVGSLFQRTLRTGSPRPR